MALTVGNGAEREMLRRIVSKGLDGTFTGVQGDTLLLKLYKGGKVEIASLA
jgi:hypothetical protein